MYAKISNQNTVLNFGPQHPAAHGVLRLILELDGERVVSSDPHIGFLHRGTEKLIESKPYKQCVPYFDRLDYVSMLSQEHAFVIAIEALLNIKPTQVELYVRVLFDELTRILNHIMCLTTHALDVGALTPFLWGFEEREKILEFYEAVSGARMHAAYYCFGGVNFDLNANALNSIFEFSEKYVNYIDSLDNLLSNNPIWLSRLKDVGQLSKKNAVNMAASGPVIRGSGIPWDIRVLQPYSSYGDFNFSTPLGVKGDSYSRYVVRLLEMRESINIIQQSISLITTCNYDLNVGNTNIKSYKAYNEKLKTKNSMEELIHNFYSNAVGVEVPKGEISCFIEAPKGETGVTVVSDGTVNPYRCKIKAPGFYHLQALDLVSKNCFIADVVTNIGSMDIVFGEIDR